MPGTKGRLLVATPLLTDPNFDPNLGRVLPRVSPPGIALDDSAGAHYVGTELHAVVASSANARGYRVGPDGEQPLETRAL